MPAVTPPFALQGGTYPATHDRLHLVTAETMRATGSGDPAREGFLPGRVPSVSVSGLTVTVGAGAVVVANDFAVNEGDYRVVLTGTSTVTLAAASTTQNRSDRLVLRVYDNLYDSLGNNLAVPEVVQGPYSAGTATMAPLPSSAFHMAELYMAANASTPVVTRARVWSAPAGGILPVTSFLDRSGVAGGEGVVVYRLDGERLEVQTNVPGNFRAVTVPTVPLASDLAAAFPTPGDDLIVWVRGVSAFYIYRNAVWQQLESAQPYGKLWRTTAFQTLASGAGTVVPLDQGRIRGGMAISGNGLVVPQAGFYRVDLNCYASGTTTYFQFQAERVRSGIGDRAVVSMQFPKTTGDDWTNFTSDEIPLAAGDLIRVRGITASGAGSVWGVSEWQGVRLGVRYVRALEGATAL